MMQTIKQRIKKQSSKLLLVIDYDRTLVNGSKELMLETKAQLIAFQKRGGTVALASGRPLSGLQNVCKQLEMEAYNGFVIAENGANVYKLATQEIIGTDLIDVTKLSSALNKLQSVSLEKGIYTPTSLVVTGYTSDLEDEATSNCLQLVISDDESTISSSSKIVLSDPNKATHNYYQQVCDILSDDFNIVKSSPRYIELTNKTVDKAVGISLVCSQLSDSVDTVIGIGDSQNDYTMLQACDYKIAMGNATSEITAICDIVIGDNESDAIGMYLK